MMMNEASKKQATDLKPGTQITGKWHGKRYLIKKKLGAGAIGAVYLSEAGGQPAALKISEKGTSMTVEVNVLKSLGKVQGNRLGPYLLDVDDWVSPSGEAYSFYVMEYLQGKSLASFLQSRGSEWTGVFMLQLLEDLEKLHQSGWVFGDLKTDNLLVVDAPPRLRWVDVGGTTKIGRAIKEYTEFYDRGYWGMGSRKAEPSYDLFAFVMVFLHVSHGKRFEKGVNPERTLFKKLDEAKTLVPYREPLKKALQGRYHSSLIMKQEIAAAINHTRSRRTARQNKHKSPVLLEMGGISALGAVYYLISLLF
ncbi:protein kinase domain-containing protein [Lentibacillus sediminis]|uniref:protein kinase domain-containing protein n=1 Tax=Lentibacillus sediminis TaxID=1940529 RepID=UPI000C1C34F6|nr:protein kinase [Lentibacillus sediminis]